MFSSGAIEHTVAGHQAQKSDSHTEDTVFSFLFCSSTSSSIEHTNLCDRALY
jgi:hypothetical protein